MNAKMILACLLALSTTGCVAAIPLVAQVASAGTSMSQLCAMAKVPGQSTSLCDRLSFGSAPEAAKPGNTVVAGANPR